MAKTYIEHADPSVAALFPAHLAPLDDRERAFVLTYPEDFNVKAAMYRAGYCRESTSASSASVMAAQMMRKPDVVEALMTELRQRSERAGLMAEAVIEELKHNIFSSIGHYEIDDHGNVRLAPGAPPGAIRAVAKVRKKIRHERSRDGETEITTYETEVSLWNKNDAIGMGMKHLGMFIDRSINVSGSIEELYKAISGGK